MEAVVLCNGDLSQMFSLHFIKVFFWEGDRKSLSHLSVEEEEGVAVAGDVVLHLRVTKFGNCRSIAHFTLGVERKKLGGH
eukprot:5381600-Ditylum_brightwellii.AAC.1